MFDINWITHKVVPGLPRGLKHAVRYAPRFPLNRSLQSALNYILAPQIEQQELDFMFGRSVAVIVQDLDLHLRIERNESGLVVEANTTPLSVQNADVTLTGDFFAFSLLITQQVDPDTLFFRRRLRMTGDTELGLHVKNLLDTVELHTRLPSLTQSWVKSFGEKVQAYSTQ
ncbi:ubiquinone anaerobic biosynthesis accessory factor UbiT [Aliidiomarina sanyensis]|uniref:Sterol-binding protein n=1 Tax=Aliidiomarina sanyensis TaxID=1249555 RepID=A0A432WRU1_9GAMM|nr:sterol-binding protein [Aliidiomarina sanyensis]